MKDLPEMALDKALVEHETTLESLKARVDRHAALIQDLYNDWVKLMSEEADALTELRQAQLQRLKIEPEVMQQQWDRAEMKADERMREHIEAAERNTDKIVESNDGLTAATRLSSFAQVVAGIAPYFRANLASLEDDGDALVEAAHTIWQKMQDVIDE